MASVSGYGSFSWRGVASSAISAGVTAGLGWAMQGGNAASNVSKMGQMGKTGADAATLGTTGGSVAQAAQAAQIASAPLLQTAMFNSPTMQQLAFAASQNAISQAVSVSVGIQKHFSWRDVAASVAATAVGIGFDGVFGETKDVLSARGAARSLVSTIASAHVRGGLQDNFTGVAWDSIGSWVGNTIAQQAAMGNIYNASEELRNRNGLDILNDQMQAQSLFNAVAARNSNTSNNVGDASGMDLYDQYATHQQHLLNPASLDEQTTFNRPSNPEQASAFDKAYAQSGKADVADKVGKNVAARQWLDGIEQQVLNTPELSTTHINTFREIQQNTALALMSIDVYFKDSIQELLPRGYSRLRGDDLRMKTGIDPSRLDAPKIGYFAAVYENRTKNEIVFANRGTDDFTKDIIASAGQGTAGKSKQYELAVNLARDLVKEIGTSSTILFTGHSLGGGLAAAQALATQRQAIVFNAATLSDGTIKRLPNGKQLVSELITNHVVKGDILHNFQSTGNVLGWKGVLLSLSNPKALIANAVSALIGPKPFKDTRIMPYFGSPTVGNNGTLQAGKQPFYVDGLTAHSSHSVVNSLFGNAWNWSQSAFKGIR